MKKNLQILYISIGTTTPYKGGCTDSFVFAQKILMKQNKKPTIEQLKKELHDLTVNRTNEKRRIELQKYIDHFNYGLL